MRRELPGGLELDDDVDRVDTDAVHDFISNHSYWAPGRPREVMEEFVRQAIRVVGLYDGERQVGFARAIGDSHFVYLADVYVLPEYRGRGLGVELVREMIETGLTPTHAGSSTRRTPTSSMRSSASGRRPSG